MCCRFRLVAGAIWEISDESWLEAGGEDVVKRANATWKRLLGDDQEPPLDAVRSEALAELVAKRRAASRPAA